MGSRPIQGRPTVAAHQLRVAQADQYAAERGLQVMLHPMLRIDRLYVFDGVTQPYLPFGRRTEVHLDTLEVIE